VVVDADHALDLSHFFLSLRSIIGA
jgi:hypothetical protein